MAAAINSSETVHWAELFLLADVAEYIGVGAWRRRSRNRRAIVVEKLSS
jgi:hypothetical protein